MEIKNKANGWTVFFGVTTVVLLITIMTMMTYGIGINKSDNEEVLNINGHSYTMSDLDMYVDDYKSEAVKNSLQLILIDQFYDGFELNPESDNQRCECCSNVFLC